MSIRRLSWTREPTLIVVDPPTRLTRVFRDAPAIGPIIQTHFRESLPTLVGQPTPFPELLHDNLHVGLLFRRYRESYRDHHPQRLSSPPLKSMSRCHIMKRRTTEETVSSALPQYLPWKCATKPPSIHGDHKRKSPTSVVVEVSTPLTEESYHRISN
ncbi:hypothetical protein EI94DRAFT_735724 [Lactarius quietus]|nr:hypothetical protein EI94DRAFT_735724 [Lactarius quietus]